MMPGMDGYAVCRALKAEPTTRASHVIVLTASVDPSSNRNVYAAGAAACLTKPLRTEALMAVVRRRGGASGSPAGRRHPGDHAAMAEAGSGPEIGRLAARDGFKVEIPSTRCRPPCVQVGASTRLPRRPDGSPLISVNRTGCRARCPARISPVLSCHPGR
ncbi:MAG: response regulator [Zetaproteobacteria bacterium]|nr:MAG: response regulator [Zetaproteobacteria bacterium]